MPGRRASAGAVLGRWMPTTAGLLPRVRHPYDEQNYCGFRTVLGMGQ